MHHMELEWHSQRTSPTELAYKSDMEGSKFGMLVQRFPIDECNLIIRQQMSGCLTANIYAIRLLHS